MKNAMMGSMALLSVVFFVHHGFSENIIYPADVTIYNVKTLGAKGNGTADDTQVLQDILDAHTSSNVTFYFPNGTYVVSNTLKWGPSNTTTNCGGCWKRTVFQGQGRDSVIIKLKNSCTGFQDTTTRKAVIWTGLEPAQRFRNGIRNMTINTGTGNPGACGIQFIANNQGTMSDVKIVSGDGKGIYGLDFIYTGEVGPMLIKNVEVDGFNYAIYAKTLNSVTYENITIKNQKVCGLLNDTHIMAIRKLTSTNSVRAVYNKGSSSYMVITDAVLYNGSSGGPAITNEGTMYVRNAQCSGYSSLLANTNGTKVGISGSSVTEFASHAVTTNFTNAPRTMLNLPVKETPEPVWDPLDQWVNPETYGAISGDNLDDTKAIQDAIDSGKKTLYFSGGPTFTINDTLYVRKNIHRITGTEGKLGGTGLIILQNGATTDPLILDRFDANYANFTIRNECSRTVVLKTLSLNSVFESNGTGDLFFEDVVLPGIVLNNKTQHFWARQLNLESGDIVNFDNKGAFAWIFMLKTERANTKIRTTLGGQSEVLCIHNYSTTYLQDMPYFVVDESSFSLACYRETNFNSQPYDIYVRETYNGQTEDLLRSEAKEFGPNAKGIGMYVSVRPGTTPALPQCHTKTLLLTSGPFPALEIFSCSGKSLGTYNADKLPLLPFGVYLVRIHSSGRIQSRSVVVTQNNQNIHSFFSF